MGISTCCGADDGCTSLDGPSWGDIGLCPDCREHCEFVEPEELIPTPERAYELYMNASFKASNMTLGRKPPFPPMTELEEIGVDYVWADLPGDTSFADALLHIYQGE